MASKASMIQADLTYENHGSIILVRGLTEEGGAFLLQAGDDAQYFGGALAVEPRYLEGVLRAAAEEGLVVR